jgi:hypothetical protein
VCTPLLRALLWQVSEIFGRPSPFVNANLFWQTIVWTVAVVMKKLTFATMAPMYVKAYVDR